jgi:Iap family predicted aminopeptidase
LEDDFEAIVSTGGRLVGSASEARAFEVLGTRLAAIPGVRQTGHRFEYLAWAKLQSRLNLLSPIDRELRAHALYWSAETPSGGLEAEVIDVGRGTEEDFERLSTRIPGRIVLVRHEYPFGSSTVHRRLKYNWSRTHGAAAFLIANNQPGEFLVTGSCGQDAADNIPAFGVSFESGQLLGSTPGARVRMRHTNARRASIGTNLIAEIPGQGPEWVIVCAHYDGHDLAESALDNATGVASALSVLRALAPHVPNLRRGLRVVLFTAEESGLLGSRRYVEDLSEADRLSIAAVINLDTTVGSDKMSCLVSGFHDLEAFVRASADRGGYEIECILPLLRNSDHFNFAEHGIPAMRLVAGFDDPAAGARFLLTEEDRRERVSLSELRRGVGLAGHLVWDALTQSTPIAEHRK